MRRTWAVRPQPGYAEVSREECGEAVIDALAHMWRSGGVVTLMGYRVKAEDVLDDGLPGEAFTSLFVVEWRDRTDARPQPEPTVTIAEPVEPAPEAHEPEDVQPEVTDDNPDGFVEEAEEDLSAVPAELR